MWTPSWEAVPRTNRSLNSPHAPKGNATAVAGAGRELEATVTALFQAVIDGGCEPHVQPLMKLNALHREPWVRFDWQEAAERMDVRDKHLRPSGAQLLRDVARWANAWVWKRAPFAEYDRSMNKSRQAPVYDEQQGLLV